MKLPIYLKIQLPLVPALLSFGPLFMVMGTDPTGGMRWFAFIGALMTSFGMLALFTLLCYLFRELQRLDAKASDKVDT